MRVDVLGAVSVSDGTAVVSGRALGGRRARVVLVALALAQAPVPAERLASIIWADELPPTWQVALRGVIRALRNSLAAIGADEQHLILTTPLGYQLARGVEVDVAINARAVTQAQSLLAQGRYQAALDKADSTVGATGEQLLPGEDAEWITAHRDAVDANALRALELIAEAAGGIGDHHRALEAARRAVGANPLDERAHRALIVALDRAGDRAGAVRAYEACRAQLAEQLGVDPSTETVAAYLSALQDQGSTSAARLPIIASAFFGRAAEEAALATATAVPGLVTVLGKGGVGKSRLVLHMASMLDFAGGRLWVPLASVSVDALVASTVAIDVGAPVGSGEPTDALAAHLAPRGRVLLILDGCEAVLDGVASLASALLTACPMLSLVVTSRVPLSIEAEHLVVIEPLPTPAGDDRESLLASSQVQLLADRVRAAGGELDLDDRAVPLLARLCRACGGLPLALELVAAQLSAMPVGDLLDHLPDVLVEEDRLRAVARSSYELLDDDEATVFRRFAVLEGSVGLPLVRQVVAGGHIAPVRIVRILRELTARGLLTVDRSGPRWRYQQDDDLHRFARELLTAGDEDAAAMSRLADAISAILPTDARAAPATYQAEITEVLGSVRSMLAAAVDRRLDRDRGLEIAFRLHRYWAASNVAEGRYWLSRLLTDAPDQGWTGHAAFALGYLSYWCGDADNAVPELQRAVELLRDVQDSYAARALIFLAGLLDDLDRGPEAVEFVGRAIAAAEPFGIDLQVSAAMGMGCVLAERADPAAAGYAADAIELCRNGGSAEQLAAAMPTASMVCWQVGALEQARAYVAEAMPMHADARRIARVVLLSTSAGIALADGDIAAAVDFGRSADTEATELGVEREAPLIRSVLAQALLRQGELPEAAERIIAAITTARAMSFSYPLAICLETGAAVALAAGETDRRALAQLLASAAVIRERGERPSPPTLRPTIDAVRAQLRNEIDDLVAETGPTIDDAAAAALAVRLLSSIV